MEILILSASEREVTLTADYLKENDFRLGRNRIKFLESGIGGVATAYSLTKYCFNHNPDLIIQAGIAGGFKKIDLGQVFVIKEEIFGDLGVWENNQFRTLHDLKLVRKNQLLYKNVPLKNPYKKLMALPSSKKVRGITVNEITTSKRSIRWYEQNCKAVVESMEGAAFHYVCLEMNIPFIQLRSISNSVGERNKSNWKMGEAIMMLNQKLIFLLTELSAYDENDLRI